MIRARLRLTTTAAAPRRRPRNRRSRASASIADAKAAPSGIMEMPPFEPSLSAGRVAEAREAWPRPSAIPAGAARPARRRTGCDDTRGGVAGRCWRSGSDAARSREAGTVAESLPRSSRPRATSAGASIGAADRTPGNTGAEKAGARPVFTSAGCAASPGGGVGRAAVAAAGTTAGAGSTTGACCTPVAGGPTGAASAPGRSSSGSTYPFGSELRRTPR